MSNLTFQIPIDEIVARFRDVLREEIGASGTGKVLSNSNAEPPITTKQLCEFLSITEPTAIRWRQKGKIPFFQIGSAIRYNKSEVMEALRITKQKTR